MENIPNTSTDNYTIQTVEQIKELWQKTYNQEGKPDWSHIIPYYAEEMEFKDSIQYINGKEEFTAMTERLSARSQDLKMAVVRATKDGPTIFVEWEMTISYKT